MEEDNKNQTATQLRDIALETLEPDAEGLLEVALKLDIADNIPVIKTAKAAVSAVRSVGDYLFLRRIKELRTVIYESPDAEHEYENLNEKEKGALTTLLISETEKQTNILQAKAMGYLTRAFLLKKMPAWVFEGLAFEMKNLNPVVFGSRENRQLFRDSGGLLSGPHELLPSIFTSSNDSNGNTIISPGNRCFTDLGRFFYNCVYLPMLKDLQEQDSCH